MTVNRIPTFYVRTKVIIVTNSNIFSLSIMIVFIVLKEMSIADTMLQSTVFVCC